MVTKDGGGGKRTGELAEIQKALIRLSGQRGPTANSEKREHFRKVCKGGAYATRGSSVALTVIQ